MKIELKNINPSEIIGQRGFVYRNLNAGKALGRVIYSVRVKGTVRLHSPYVQIDEAEFRSARGNSVSYGWSGVRESGRKNVHAGVFGLISSTSIDEEASLLLGTGDWQIIGYDPRRDQSFMLLDHRTREPILPVSKAERVICCSEDRGDRIASWVMALGVK